MDHEFGEEGSVGIIGLVIPFGPGNPILNLQDQCIDDMQQEAAEKGDLEDLDQDVVAHEMSGFVEHHGVIEDDNQ
jgi:hypothetical protein